MGITSEIFPQAKKIYKKLIKSKSLNNFIHKCLNFFISCWSSCKGFYFPAKFPWDWKLEMLLGKYEQATVALFKKIIKPGMIVFDIGAHIGYFTVLFSGLAGAEGKVYAFEPDNNNFILLKKNTKKYSNVQTFQQAIADKIGSLNFYEITGSTMCHTIIPTDNADKIAVSATTIDHFIEEQKIKVVNIIKIDIEGGEPLAFKGMARLFREAKDLSILMEYNPSALQSGNFDSFEFLKSLTENGFNIFQILNKGELKPLTLSHIQDLKFYRTGFANLLLKKKSLNYG